jgi:hypothetical protein
MGVLVDGDCDEKDGVDALIKVSAHVKHPLGTES